MYSPLRFIRFPNYDLLNFLSKPVYFTPDPPVADYPNSGLSGLGINVLDPEIYFFIPMISQLVYKHWTQILRFEGKILYKKTNN